jgi:hypothetical protein
MKRYFVTVIRYRFPLLAMAMILFLAPSRMTQAATAVPTFQNEFNGTSLNPQWSVIHGNPTVANGKLRLAGGVSELAEIESIRRFSYGVLQMSIPSSHWIPSFKLTCQSRTGINCERESVASHPHMGSQKCNPSHDFRGSHPGQRLVFLDSRTGERAQNPAPRG